MKKVDLTLILPCYNEGPTLETSINKIFASLKKSKYRFEVIFVEDKSSDSTLRVVKKAVKNNRFCKLITHNKNMGRGKSVSDGIIASRANVCGYIDIDCEISPAYIPLFVKEILKGYDLVVGKRFYEGGFKNLTRVLSSKLYAFIVRNLIQLPIDDTETGYKFFNRKKILPLLKNVKDKHWFWDTEICLRAYEAGLKVDQVPVIFRRRAEKKTTVKMIPDTIEYIKNLVRIKREIISVN